MSNKKWHISWGMVHAFFKKRDLKNSASFGFSTRRMILTHDDSRIDVKEKVVLMSKSKLYSFIRFNEGAPFAANWRSLKLSLFVLKPFCPLVCLFFPLLSRRFWRNDHRGLRLRL
jgi:hypothetical protein